MSTDVQRIIRFGQRSGKTAQFEHDVASLMASSPHGYYQATARMILRPGSEGVVVLERHDLFPLAFEAITKAVGCYPTISLDVDYNKRVVRLSNGSGVLFVDQSQSDRLRGLELDWALALGGVPSAMYSTLIERRATILPQ